MNLYMPMVKHSNEHVVHDLKLVFDHFVHFLCNCVCVVGRMIVYGYLQLRREKIDLENTLEQEQEMLVNKLWKRMDKVMRRVSIILKLCTIKHVMG